ncbi:MAG: beta-propeller domain-containing protein [Syntrophomonadaceae bacterium]
MGLPAAKGRVFLAGILVALLLAVLSITWRIGPNRSQASARAELPVVGSYENLIKLLEKTQGQYLYGYGRMAADNVAKVANEAAAPQAAGAPADVPDFSGTNLQVAGVDESDLVKTDGTYIYQVDQQRINIIKAQPAETMALAATIGFTDAGFQPAELYVDGSRLVVIGTRVTPMPYPMPYGELVKTSIYPPIYSTQMTRAIIYDITDPNHPAELRQLELEGNYLSSRKVGSSFYLLSNKYINYYSIQEHPLAAPVWRDTVQGQEYVAEKYEDIRYFPDCINPNYLMVAAVDLEQPKRAADISTYLGSGEEVYASVDNLYVAVQKHDYGIQPRMGEMMLDRPAESTTTIYKFGLQPGKIQYLGSGQVPGRILNQFSMDEHKGCFRIATTRGEVWRNDQYASSNNVYILDNNLQMVGRLENIAPGEQIYSTRFMGDRAYMVTFKKVDPFFVLDLSNPASPQILGKLKIPGYSDYLHPYDEKHIIGFGKDTIELKTGGDQSQAYYQGMKIALFDVSDVANPVEISKVLIGDRGTDSELLHNHKALLFSAPRSLLAFPVTVMEVKGSTVMPGMQPFPAYGSFSYQGLYVYNIDLINGLQLRGRISHLSGQDYLAAGDSWYHSRKNIERALYIGDTLYTLSGDLVQAHDLASLALKNTLYLGSR